nr:helix-turn-helix domain-containing protein [Psychromicrobium silvestre]
MSRESVLDAALALADREGLPAVTVRRLAGEFGVTPMAMYWHFANKDELLAAMGQAVLFELEVQAEASFSELLRGLVTVLRKHPAAVSLVPTQMFATSQGLQVTERALALLAELGFSVGEAANIARTAMDLCVMLVVGEPGREIGMDECEREKHLAGKLAAIRGLSAEQYPHVLAAAEPLTGVGDAEEFYRSSVELFVAGVEARAFALR